MSPKRCQPRVEQAFGDVPTCIDGAGMKGHDGDGYSFEIEPLLQLLRVKRVGEFTVSCIVNFSIDRMLSG